MQAATQSSSRWLWWLLLPALVWMQFVASSLPIDRHHRAMRAPASPEADAAADLRAAFGDQDPILLVFQGSQGLPLGPAQLRALNHHVAALQAEPGVQAVGRPASPRPDVVAFPVTVAESCDAQAITEVAKLDLPDGITCLVGGLPLVEQAIAQAIATDRAHVVPLLAVVLFVVLAALFRSLTQALCGLAPAVTAILLIGAMRVISGAALNPITILIDPVLLTVGVAAAVHVIATFRRIRASGASPRDAAVATRVDILRPASLATLTTMLGFASLAFQPIPAVSEFGCWAAFGTGVAHALVLLSLPRLLADWAPAAAAVRPAATASNYVAALQKNRRLILLACSASTVIAAAALTRSKVDNDPMSVLPADHLQRRQLTAMANLLGGGDRFCLLVNQAPSIGRERLMLFCADVATTWPATGLAGKPLLGEKGAALVPVLLSPSGSNDRCKLFDAIAAKSAALGIEGIRPAGTSVQIARDSQRLVHGQLLGLGATCVMLAIALGVALRSARAGLLGMIPNLLPCLWLYGGIALLDRPLTVANAMIGSVMLGLVVDNTIHLMHRFSEHSGKTPSRLVFALDVTLAPMLISSAVLAAGLGAGVFGAMQSTKDFAILAATTIVLALFGVAVLLPTMMLRGKASETSA